MGPVRGVAPALGTLDQRKKNLMGLLGVGPQVDPRIAAAQQQMVAGMDAAGQAPKAFAMPGAAPGAPAVGLTAGLGTGAAPLGAPPMMGPPPPPVAAPSSLPPPAVADQIRNDYLNNLKAPMQAAAPPINKLAAGLNALGSAGAGLAALGDRGTGAGIAGAGIGAGLGMLGSYLKDRRGKKNIGTSAFAEGGVVRMAMGGAGKTRKKYPRTGPMPKKDQNASPLAGNPVARGMGKATRGHNFKGSL